MTVEIEFHIKLDQETDKLNEHQWVLSVSRRRAEELWFELGEALGVRELDMQEEPEPEMESRVYRVYPDGTLGERIDQPTAPETDALTGLSEQQERETPFSRMTPEEAERYMAARQATGHIPKPHKGSEIGNLPR